MPITSSTSKLGRQTRALRHSFASHHLAKFTDAARLALELGHTNQELLFRHAEVWLLDEIFDRYGKMSRWELVELIHTRKIKTLFLAEQAAGRA